MAKRVGVDKWLFGTVLVLVLFGLVMVFSASAVLAKATLGSPYAYVSKQAIWALLGLIALFVLMRVDYRRYNSPRIIFPLMISTGVMLLGVFAWRSMNGAHRWLHLGPASLQPSELAKPVIVLFLAWFLQTRIHAIDDIKQTIVPAVIPPYGAGVRGGGAADVVSGRHADEVDRRGVSVRGAGDVLHAGDGALAVEAH
jgi:cell division protein FtsW